MDTKQLTASDKAKETVLLLLVNALIWGPALIIIAFFIEHFVGPNASVLGLLAAMSLVFYIGFIALILRYGS